MLCCNPFIYNQLPYIRLIHLPNPCLYEILDLSRNGAYDGEKEKQVYERDFKPRARILKKRTEKSIRKELRGGKGGRRYYVSNPGTMTIVRDREIEWYTLGDEEVTNFLKTVLRNGHVFLEELCR